MARPEPQSLRTTSRRDRRDAFALLATAVAIGAWLFMPEIGQPQGYRGCADRRAFLGVPNAADLLSNLAFVAVALFGVGRLALSMLPLVPAFKVGRGVERAACPIASRRPLIFSPGAMSSDHSGSDAAAPVRSR